METVINSIAFPGLVILWLAFGLAAVGSPGSLNTLWHRFRRLPLIFQLLVWLLLFPLVLALYIWQASWPFWLRVLLVVGLAAVTIDLFFPGGSLV